MFWSKHKKKIYPCKPQFYYIKVGCKGLFVTRTCFLDEHDILNYLLTVRFQFEVEVLSECAISAIACDDDSALKYIMDLLKSRKHSDDLTIGLPYICDVLGKTRQKNILTGYCYHNESKMDNDHQFHLEILHYLRKH